MSDSVMLFFFFKTVWMLKKILGSVRDSRSSLEKDGHMNSEEKGD